MVRTTYAKEEFHIPGHLSKMMTSANLGIRFFKVFFQKRSLDKFLEKSVPEVN